MLYMVIEVFKPGMKDAIYDRYAERGRMLPEGLEYVSSWVEENGSRCFQLMQCERRELFLHWVKEWADLTDFEIVPVTVSPTNQDQA